MRKNSFAARLLPATAVALCAALGARAEVQYSFDGGVGSSDNITRVAEDEVDETIASLGGQLSWLHESPRLYADVLGDIAYLDYLDDTYDSEVTGNFVGALTLHAIPDRLDWVFNDNFGQARRDPLAAVTPGNRENINLFSTGPDFVMGLGVPNLQARLSARYANVAYETSNFDSDRYGGLLTVERTMSSSAVLSAHAALTQVRPKDEAAAGSEYDMNEYYLGYSLDAARTSLSVDAGVTQVDRDGEKDDGFLLRLNLVRHLSDRATINFGAGREHSDSGQSLRFLQGIEGIDADASSLNTNPQPFVSEYANFGWNALGRRTRVNVSAAWMDQEYLDQPVQDRQELTVSGGIARDLGPTLTLGFDGNYLSEDFKNTPGDYDEMTLSVSLAWRIGRLLNIDILFDRVERSGDGPNADFAENRAWLMLRYGDTPSRRVPKLREESHR